MTSQDDSIDPAAGVAAEEDVVARLGLDEEAAEGAPAAGTAHVSPAPDASASVDDPAADAWTKPGRTRD